MPNISISNGGFLPLEGGTLSGNLLFTPDNTLDIGSVAASVHSIYVDTIIYATSVQGNWSPSADATYTLGTTTYNWLGLELKGYINNRLIAARVAANDNINAAPTAIILTAANTKSFTMIAQNTILPSIAPTANGGGITLTSLNFGQGAITNIADSEAITVKHIVMTGAAGAALETGAYTWTGIDITTPAQAANAATNLGKAIKITGGATAGGASATQIGIDITMAAATDYGLRVNTGVSYFGGNLDFADGKGLDSAASNTATEVFRLYENGAYVTGLTGTNHATEAYWAFARDVVIASDKSIKTRADNAGIVSFEAYEGGSYITAGTLYSSATAAYWLFDRDVTIGNDGNIRSRANNAGIVGFQAYENGSYVSLFSLFSGASTAYIGLNRNIDGGGKSITALGGLGMTSGAADLLPTSGSSVSVGTSCNFKRFYQEITLDTGDAETAVGLTPSAVILSAAIRVSEEIAGLDEADHHIQLGINGTASKYIDVAQGGAATTISVNKKGNYKFDPTTDTEAAALVLTITGGADQTPTAGKVYVEVIYLDSTNLADV